MTLRRVWVLSDGVTGHSNQAIGIVNLLFGDDAKVETIDTRLRLPALSRPLLRFLYNHIGPRPWVRSLTQRLYSHTLPAARHPSEILISAGGNTRFLNVASGGANIFIGSLRRLNGNLFRVLLTMEPAGCETNVLMTLPPSRLSPESADRAGAQYRKRLIEAGKTPNTKLWTLLVGGDGAGFSYNESDWYNLVSLVSQLAQQHGIRWLITTSRRTSAVGQQYLKKALDDQVVAEASWHGEPQKGTLIEYVGASERVFCTADSMSMLGDALNAGKPACALMPREATPNQRYKEALKNFRDRYALQCWPLAEKDTSNLELPTPADLRARVLDDRDDLKKRILTALSDDGAPTQSNSDSLR
jgi:mitochondrial fission protein ELM1